MKTRQPIGSLGPFIRRHLKLHRSLGYLMNGAEYTLLQFDRFLAQHYPKVKTVTRDIVVHYLKTLQHYHSSSLHTSMAHLRKFCRFLFCFNLDTYIPERGLIAPARRKVTPYIYTDRDMAALLELAQGLKPSDSLRSHTCAALVSLLWVTGLRIREALRLNLQDIDYHQGLLYVRETKFFKSRVVPLSPTAISGLKSYQRRRARYHHDQKASAPLFVNERAKRCTYITVSYTFRHLVRQSGIKTPEGTYPRLHDIRHAFATRSLADFYRKGKNASAYLPILATYLGHVNIDCTSVYLHPSIELLTRAGQRFRRYVSH